MARGICIEGVSMSGSGSIPQFNLSAQLAELEGKLTEAAQKVIASGHYILGPSVQKFEQELGTYVGTSECVSCASGSDALLLSLMAMGIGPGDEVLVPAFTFFSTASAIQRVGATPVFVDSGPNYNMNVIDLDLHASPKTKAVIVVHLFGLPAQMNVVRDWVKSRAQQIYVIEDCAQSLGSKHGGRVTGSIGDMGTHSFYPTKNLGGLGDGGAITTSNSLLTENLRILRMHGEKKKYYHDYMGINSRLDEIQAAMLSVKLPYLDRFCDQRRAIAARYFDVFAEAGIEDFVTMPLNTEDSVHGWNQFTIRAKNRDKLREFLAEREIGSNIYYPLPLHLQKSFAYLGYKRGDLPECERMSREVLSLPIFPEMQLDLCERVVEGVRNFYLNNSQ